MVITYVMTEMTLRNGKVEKSEGWEDITQVMSITWVICIRRESLPVIAVPVDLQQQLTGAGHDVL